MNRTVVRQALLSDVVIAAKVGERVLPAGSIKHAPADKPFILMRVGNVATGPFNGVMFRDFVLWVHDNPGGYVAIDELLEDIRRVMRAVPNGDGLFEFAWQGDSADLADDALGTITRNGTYRAWMKGGD